MQWYSIAIENARLYNKAQKEIKERSETEEELRRVAAKNQAILADLERTLSYNTSTRIVSQQIS